MQFWQRSSLHNLQSDVTLVYVPNSNSSSNSSLCFGRRTQPLSLEAFKAAWKSLRWEQGPSLGWRCWRFNKLAQTARGTFSVDDSVFVSRSGCHKKNLSEHLQPFQPPSSLVKSPISAATVPFPHLSVYPNSSRGSAARWSGTWLWTLATSLVMSTVLGCR